jgi:hypothetical protein
MSRGYIEKMEIPVKAFLDTGAGVGRTPRVDRDPCKGLYFR